MPVAPMTTSPTSRSTSSAQPAGRDSGGGLLGALVARARELGYHKLVLSAFPGNEAGMRAYRRAGFRDVGVYREQGRLDGRWVDTIVMEKRLEGPHAH